MRHISEHDDDNKSDKVQPVFSMPLQSYSVLAKKELAKLAFVSTAFIEALPLSPYMHPFFLCSSWKQGNKLHRIQPSVVTELAKIASVSPADKRLK